MAEYIEREALLKHYNALANIAWNEKVAPASWSEAYRSFAEHLEELPTADVVPKSEYDAVVSAVDNSTKEFLKLHDEYQDAKSEYDELKLKYNLAVAEREANVRGFSATVLKHKAEVAKEIFEEIENEINNELQNNYKVLPRVEFSNEIWNRISGRINALQGIRDFIAELKKKYTEGEK